LKIELTQEYIKSIFDYKDGILYWKIKPFRSSINIGDRAGCPHIGNGNRYTIRINNKNYYASRMIFLYHKGYLPKIVDHENRIQTDDHIENLRDADYSTNGKNRNAKKNGSSIYLGVHLNRRKDWIAAININGKQTHIGSFKIEENAALAYNRMAVMHHGEFANLNIILPK